MHIDFEPGDYVLNPANKSWGIGQIQSIIGNKVTVKEEGVDDPEVYYLLGPIEFELDLFPMIVTYHSPFAQEMIGKKINETFMLDIESKETKFTVTAIETV